MIFCVGTMDTKGREVDYLVRCMREFGVESQMVDIGAGANPQVVPHISRETMWEYGASQGDNGTAKDKFDRLSLGLGTFLLEKARSGVLKGVIGIGGSTGTAIIAPALQRLPLGIPKVLISTVASGNVSPYVGTSDLCLINSVADIAGLNSVTRGVLRNGAAALYGMVKNYNPIRLSEKTVAMTMFGVTTPAVDAMRKKLEAEHFDCVVFHATGIGGRAMENLAKRNVFSAVMDITTTEIADEVVGGIMAGGPDRLDVIIEKEIPLVLSLGGLDMVNFGPIDAVPEKFSQRCLCRHNAFITLMRTSPEENRRFGRWIAGKLNRATGPYCLLIPEKGVSELDKEGNYFWDPEADKALFSELELSLPAERIRRIPFHINDPQFGEEALEALADVLQEGAESSIAQEPGHSKSQAV